MDSREVRGLMEAYLDVYASEEEIDEGLRSAVKRLFGKKGAPAANEPMSRGDQLRNKYNVGPEKSDTSAKRQILNRTLARKNSDEAKYGGSIYTQGVAQQSANAHDRYLKAGYSKYGANLKHGRGNKARERAAQLNMGDEFQNWVEALLDEGYDLSNYTWDDMYEAYTELVEANSGYNMEKIKKDPLAAMTPATFLKAKKPGQQFASPRRSGPGGGRIPSSMAPSRTAAAVADLVRGSERNISTSRRLPTEPKTTKMVKKDGKWVKVEEAFDFVLAHLVSEGYVDNFDSAIKIMVNMSEEWRNEILDKDYQLDEISDRRVQAKK